ncbi:hypothetical protein BS50DRAFT_63310 [Corynespora cassiicola Philippines]|uniref:Arrestin C-terminal-like domain-containing protein n=1 Tax=Corynespora cassiicola Philippines TaxID=1448308 RepID=A0A2T2NJL3_CORCC|nr:hypothetical protein BS50DRAFT_63310 [Corynespora cassiicola Philippines]
MCATYKSKTRNFADFHIQPDDPHRQYAPGDLISGSVIIKVLKPLRITHLVVSLHGYAQVFKNPNSPGDAYKNYSTTVGTGKGRKTGSYFGNGFASLFEDEVVLCGEGRLGEGVYHFNFELEFPTKGLPSSIDFERGTVSYMLTSTLTRPTTISPTASCDTPVNLMETIDVAPIPAPKPRVISLEPISRRQRTKPPKKRPAVSETGRQGAEPSDSVRNGRVSELNSVAEESEGPGSPSPSDVSFDSQGSSGGASGTEYGVRSINTAVDGLQNGSRTTVSSKTITATIDVLKGGVLRGDSIPIKISVNHTKHVRSLKGIIVTLYRQARVDMHPALPVLQNSKGDKLKSEDYYPKSKTGLGGLSLSSAGSSHLFRKDLSQSFAPLFVDPRTLTAEVKCAVRVPDEAFPTISNVPGAMISFRYYIEVIVDIQGKLSALDRVVPNGGLVAVPNGPVSGTGKSEDGNTFSTWGGSFVDTDAIRREKGVISCSFEVVIGTKDSDRNGKQRQQVLEQGYGQPSVHEIPYGPNGEAYSAVGTDHDYYYGDESQWYGHYGYEGQYAHDGSYYDAPGYHEGHGYHNGHGYHESTVAEPPYHPPVNQENEEELSEKERIKRAEARLLPSQPPGEAGPSSPPATQGIPPSAPMLPEDDEPHPPYFPPSSSSTPHPPPPFSSAPSSSSRPGMNSLPRRMTGDDARSATGSSLTINANPHSPAVHTNGNDPNGTKPLPAVPNHTLSPAPEYFPSSSSHVEPTDDKHEMQRRRLEIEASAPPTQISDDEQPSAPPTTDMQHLTLAPSAPMLDDDDEGLVDAVRPGRGGASNSSNNGAGSSNAGASSPSKRHSEALPEYQR